jgi:hypothetical protein
MGKPGPAAPGDYTKIKQGNNIRVYNALGRLIEQGVLHGFAVISHG